MREQPGAVLGDQTYCPVSGVVFKVVEQSTKRDGLYFCCEACAQHFASHHAEIAKARRW